MKEEVKTMKYETPELTALTAVNAIQTPGSFKVINSGLQDAATGQSNDAKLSYVDWED
jgi:hypothetical protein